MGERGSRKVCVCRGLGHRGLRAGGLTAELPLVTCLLTSFRISLSFLLPKKNDAARAWIKEAGRMNHLKPFLLHNDHNYE